MIISLTGKKQSGKDTVATIIKALFYCQMANIELTEENYNSLKDCQVYNFENVKFAKKLKEISAMLLGVPIESFESEDFKNMVLGEQWWCYVSDYGNVLSYLNPKERQNYEDYTLVKMTPRIFLQRLATDAIRWNLHPDTWINSTLADYKPKKFWVITDTRFPNELSAIERTAKCLKIKVLRPDQEITDFHESEIALDDYQNWDFVIENNGSLGELISKVKQVLLETKFLKIKPKTTMTPKEKAEHLLLKYSILKEGHNELVKKCAIMAVDEIIEVIDKSASSYLDFWEQVKEEIILYK